MTFMCPNCIFFKLKDEVYKDLFIVIFKYLWNIIYHYGFSSWGSILRLFMVLLNRILFKLKISTDRVMFDRSENSISFYYKFPLFKALGLILIGENTFLASKSPGLILLSGNRRPSIQKFESSGKSPPKIKFSLFFINRPWSQYSQINAPWKLS